MAKKKVVVKKPKKVKAEKPLKAAKPLKAEKPLQAESFEVQVKAVLSHILELFKASLIDAFRQYIESKLKASQPASVDEFMEGFKHTVSIHGISKETLLGSLDDYELEYVKNGTKKQTITMEVAPRGEPVKEPVKKEEPKKEEAKVSVFDGLDLI